MKTVYRLVIGSPVRAVCILIFKTIFYEVETNYVFLLNKGMSTIQLTSIEAISIMIACNAQSVVHDITFILHIFIHHSILLTSITVVVFYYSMLRREGLISCVVCIKIRVPGQIIVNNT